MLTIQLLIDTLIERKSSDLHLTADVPPAYRIHGELIQLTDMHTPTQEEMVTLSKELVGENYYKKFEEENELDAAISYKEYRIRVNFYVQMNKIAWALRLLPDRFFPLDMLGLPEQVVQNITQMQKGLVLVTGATGSGKSTTLASIIHEINKTRKDHIVTIEDPVEYVHTSVESFVTQREVGVDTSSFHEALRRVLREDPDVVLIGEMRDTITMRAALTLAETGHLTFATLHTSDAPQTVSRIIGSFPADEQEMIRTQLATTLSYIICQQLLPTADGKGRTMVSEVLVGTPAVRALVRENKIHQIPSLIQTGHQMGMRSMDAVIKQRYQAGIITRQTAIEYANSRDDIQYDLR